MTRTLRTAPVADYAPSLILLPATPQFDQLLKDCKQLQLLLECRMNVFCWMQRNGLDADELGSLTNYFADLEQKIAYAGFKCRLCGCYSFERITRKAKRPLFQCCDCSAVFSNPAAFSENRRKVEKIAEKFRAYLEEIRLNFKSNA